MKNMEVTTRANVSLCVYNLQHGAGYNKVKHMIFHPFISASMLFAPLNASTSLVDLPFQ